MKDNNNSKKSLKFKNMIWRVYIGKKFVGYSVGKNYIDARIDSCKQYGVSVNPWCKLDISYYGDKASNNLRKQLGVSLKRKRFYAQLEKLNKKHEIKETMQKIVDKLENDK